MFPETLQQELNIKHVNFNPVPKTDIKRILTIISDNERELNIPKDIIINLSESCEGDIRTAINTLQFTFSVNVQSDKQITKNRRPSSTAGM